MNLRIVASHTIVCLCFAVASNAQIYKDPKAGIDERVEDLLSRMTLEEKIAQMNMNGMGEYRQLPYGAGVVESPFISVQEIARMSARPNVVPVSMLWLRASERESVILTLPYDELAQWNASMQRVVEPGEFAVMIGRSAEDIVLSGSFAVGD